MPGKHEQRRTVSVRARLARPLALVLHVLVLTVLVGATTAWAVTEKTVTVTVDGRSRMVTTHGGTVRDVLAAASLKAGPHDLVAPAVDATIGDGDRVALRRGRQLQLVVDGAPRRVWVTAASVDEALDQIGLRASGAFISASRSRRIPVGGLSFEVRLPKAVAILADGHVTTLTTTGPTVRDALIEAGVKLHPADRLSAARNDLLTDHMTIRITRVVGHRVTESFPIPFATVRHPDESLFKGTTKVLVEGRPGVLLRTYTVNFVNGKLHSKLLGSEKRTAAPVTQVIAVGTKPRPAVQRSTGTSADGLNWPALARCESGGNPRAVSSSGAYRGLYQFSMGTWHGVGGSGDPIDASPSEQTYRAKILYSRSGRSPWPVCGKYL
ncbi:MAG: resuscitation-promoting factor RpfB [Actinomycetota bacterium]|nr:resuscitation-promoting factor RpfB [Actinomycetota bacterium]